MGYGGHYRWYESVGFQIGRHRKIHPDHHGEVYSGRPRAYIGTDFATGQACFVTSRFARLYDGEDFPLGFLSLAWRRFRSFFPHGRSFSSIVRKRVRTRRCIRCWLLDRLLATRPNLMMHESSEKRRFCQETWQSRALYPLGRLLATRLTGELLLTGQLAA
jgi:hypothetical protein